MARTSLPKIPTFSSEDPGLSRAFSLLEELLRVITTKEVLDGQLIEDVALLSASNPNSVEHKLSREPLGYFVVKRSANSTVWDQAGALESRYLYLRCDANVTVTLWVF